MVAVLIFHGRSDLDWAMALAGELSEHAPVRFQLTAAPPKVKFGPSVVRVGLWSDDSMGEGIAHTMSALLAAEPTHSVLMRRGDCPSPGELETGQLAGDLRAADAGEAAGQLRIAIPNVAAAVEDIAAGARAHKHLAATLQQRRADRASWGAAALIAAGLALAFDWWGVRTWLVSLVR